MQNSSRFRPSMGLSAFLGLLILVCAIQDGNAAASLVGQQYKEIAAEGWINSKGLSLKEQKGKVVVLEFWATWCPPCRRSIPHLNRLYNRYSGRGVTFISLTSEKKNKVKSFSRKVSIEYPVGYGSQSYAEYNVRGIPHAFVIDRKGIIVWEGHPLSDSLQQVVDDALTSTTRESGAANNKNREGENGENEKKED